MPNISSPKTNTIPKFIRDTEVEDLKQQKFFNLSEISEKTLLKIIKPNVSRICSINRGDKLIPSRDKDYLYLIIKGFLVIYLPSELTLNNKNFIAWRDPQQIIGEMKALDAKPNQAIIEACEYCEFIEIESDALTNIADTEPNVYKNLAILLMKKTYQERTRSEVIQMYPAMRQVAKAILNLIYERCAEDKIKKAESENRILIPGNLKQDEIAGYIGKGRTTVNPHLTKLMKEGIISYKKKPNIGLHEVLDLKKLREKAING